MDRTLVIVQARLSSTRLPRKILAPLGDYTVLGLLLKRLENKRVIVSMPIEDSKDQELWKELDKLVDTVYFGIEASNDVLGRFASTAKANIENVDRIVRITADSPLIDPNVIDQALSLPNLMKLDYVSNTVIRTFPDGQDVEVFTPEGLEILNKNTHHSEDREHVTTKACELLVHRPFFCPQPAMARVKMSVDTQDDLEWVRWLVGKLGPNARYSQYALARMTHTNAYLKKRTPAGTQTLSKAPIDKFPVVYSAKEAKLKTRDHGELLDWTMGLGTVILGYNHKPILEAEREIVKAYGGHSFSYPTELEGLAADAILKHTEGTDQVRFFKNGSDAIAGACRLARAYTKRKKILYTGYHGWHDPFVSALGDTKGTIKDPYTHSGIELGWISRELAAIIIEPELDNFIKPEFEYKYSLLELQKLCHDSGVLVIADEVITGFRHRLGKMIPSFGDITCYGKCLGNGAPISAICAREEIMRLAAPCHLSSTFGGEIGSLAACIATIGCLEKEDYPNKNTLGLMIKNAFSQMEGPTSRPYLQFPTDDSRRIFVGKCLKKHISSLGIHNISFAHTYKDILDTIEVYKEIL